MKPRRSDCGATRSAASLQHQDEGLISGLAHGVKGSRIAAAAMWVEAGLRSDSWSGNSMCLGGPKKKKRAGKKPKLERYTRVKKPKENFFRETEDKSEEFKQERIEEQ